MIVDAGLAVVIAAGVAAIPASINIVLTLKQGHKVRETHKQVTVNHHSSDFPTVLDRLDDVQNAVLGLGAGLNDLRGDFNKHVTHANEMDLRIIKMEVSKEAQEQIRRQRAESEV